MRVSIFKIIALFAVVVLTTSCASKKTILYLQGQENSKEIKSALSFEPKIQPDDLLSIIVTSENPDAAVPYNIVVPGTTGFNVTNIQMANDARITYLVDKGGNVNMPILGEIQLGGLSRTEAIVKIQSLLATHLSNSNVNLRIMNFKVSVIGEVNRPGQQSILTERVTLLDAISAAGDLSIYGKRDGIYVIREQAGLKTINKVDIRHPDFISSPYYYLSQNDVVYVEPNKTKVNSSVVGPNIAVIFSIISLAITVITLITTSHK